ncbi:hypothetical protein ACVMHR_003624 [Bradyrhizobium diazoefficiens]
MKCLALLCLLVLAAPAHAATPEQRYLELHDRYIAKFSKAAENDETSRQHDAALNELAGVLRGLVGPVAIKGLPAEGKSNADTLFRVTQASAISTGSVLRRKATSCKLW